MFAVAKRSWLFVLALLAAGSLGALIVADDRAGAGAGATAGCDRIAAPAGSNSNPGTLRRPVRTAKRLVHLLRKGDTGCLRAGRYARNDEVKLATPEITLRSYPGERATLRGRLWVSDAARGATVSNLELDGRNDRGLPSPTINADGVRLARNDITNHHTGICVSVGSPPKTYGRAYRTLIEGNRIHDCGTLPPTNFDHGVYVGFADRTVIRNNLIYDNADRGIQLYPDAQKTRVIDNWIDDNGQGVIFGGDETTASSGNLVARNVITDSRVRHNIESSWGGPVGTGNIARDNCVGGGAYDDGDGGIADQIGFIAVETSYPSGTGGSCALRKP
jgi:nitrous oxidase accessory protein NosD